MFRDKIHCTDEANQGELPVRPHLIVVFLDRSVGSNDKCRYLEDIWPDSAPIAH